MRKLLSVALVATMSAGLIFTACQQENIGEEIAVPESVVAALDNLGFDGKSAFVSGDGIGYIVENDIYLTDADIQNMTEAKTIDVIDTEQYSTNNLVTGAPRVITLYMGGGRKGFPSGMQAGLDEAIARFNAENLGLTFTRTSDSRSADIVFKRLSRRDERRGVLGSAGFPTSGGDPYGEIKMSGILESSYGLSTDGIATIIAHEMGHCIGFRHTDYFDRSISCGGSTANEGDGGVGANHIPGTPTGADLAGNGSWMLACTDGSDRPFTQNDKTALEYLY